MTGVQTCALPIFLYLLIAHIGAIAILLCFGVLQGGSGDYTFDGMRAALDDFRERFLLRNAEEGLNTSVSLGNIARAIGGGVNDSQFTNWLDVNVFDGARFDAFREDRRPRVWINASDIYNRTPFVFGRTAFDALWLGGMALMLVLHPNAVKSGVMSTRAIVVNAALLGFIPKSVKKGLMALAPVRRIRGGGRHVGFCRRRRRNGDAHWIHEVCVSRAQVSVSRTEAGNHGRALRASKAAKRFAMSLFSVT